METNEAHFVLAYDLYLDSLGITTTFSELTFTSIVIRFYGKKSRYYQSS